MGLRREKESFLQVEGMCVEVDVGPRTPVSSMIVGRAGWAILTTVSLRPPGGSENLLSQRRY